MGLPGIFQRPTRTERLSFSQACSFHAAQRLSYFGQGNGRFTVQTSRDGAMREIDVVSETNKTYQTGDKTIITGYKDGTLYIQ